MKIMELEFEKLFGGKLSPHKYSNQSNNFPDLTVPSDYIYFIEKYHQFQGQIQSVYFDIYDLDSAIELNKRINTEQFIPGCFIFGSNGANTAFGIDMRKQEKSLVYVETDFICMGWDAIFGTSQTLTGLLWNYINRLDNK
jgi:hypothetical protein